MLIGRAGSFWLLLTAVTYCASAQERPQTFDVASVKINNSGSEAMGGNIGVGPSGKISMKNVTLQVLVGLAYQVETYRIAGAPGWMSTARYDIEARSSIPDDRNAAHILFQNLLAERFHLKLHHEMRQAQGYVLGTGKGTVKLTPSKYTTERGFQTMSRNEMQGEGISMAMFARTLKAVLDAPVEDRTGIGGMFDISLKWTPEDAIAAGETGPSIVTAVRDELGLVIKAAKVPVEFLVIDHAEKQPEAN